MVNAVETITAAVALAVTVAIGCSAVLVVAVAIIVAGTIAVTPAVVDGITVGAALSSQAKPAHNLELKKHSCPQPALIWSADKKESRHS